MLDARSAAAPLAFEFGWETVTDLDGGALVVDADGGVIEVAGRTNPAALGGAVCHARLASGGVGSGSGGGDKSASSGVMRESLVFTLSTLGDDVVAIAFVAFSCAETPIAGCAGPIYARLTRGGSVIGSVVLPGGSRLQVRAHVDMHSRTRSHIRRARSQPAAAPGVLLMVLHRAGPGHPWKLLCAPAPLPGLDANDASATHPAALEVAMAAVGRARQRSAATFALPHLARVLTQGAEVAVTDVPAARPAAGSVARSTPRGASGSVSGDGGMHSRMSNAAPPLMTVRGGDVELSLDLGGADLSSLLVAGGEALVSALVAAHAPPQPPAPTTRVYTVEFGWETPLDLDTCALMMRGTAVRQIVTAERGRAAEGGVEHAGVFGAM